MCQSSQSPGNIVMDKKLLKCIHEVLLESKIWSPMCKLYEVLLTDSLICRMCLMEILIFSTLTSDILPVVHCYPVMNIFTLKE